jgi:hypothetical protein
MATTGIGPKGPNIAELGLSPETEKRVLAGEEARLSKYTKSAYVLVKVTAPKRVNLDKRLPAIAGNIQDHFYEEVSCHVPQFRYNDEDGHFECAVMYLNTEDAGYVQSVKGLLRDAITACPGDYGDTPEEVDEMDDADLILRLAGLAESVLL